MLIYKSTDIYVLSSRVIYVNALVNSLSRDPLTYLVYKTGPHFLQANTRKMQTKTEILPKYDQYQLLIKI